MIAVAITGILASLAVPTYTDFLYKARIARTVAELHGLAKEIQGFALSTEQYPDTLAQIGRSTLLDPWGNPYQYYRINCSPVTLGHLDQLDLPDHGSDGRIVPVTTPFPPHEGRALLTVGTTHTQALVQLVAKSGSGSGSSASGGGSSGSGASGAGGGGAGGGGGSGNGGGGPPCGGVGGARKDRFLVPINSDFDIYSMGRDGQTVAPLTAKKSHDDIIRASDGGFYGLAAYF
jgi:general secretion pathway protein G